MSHSQSLQQGTNCPSPITRVLAFGYYDGPTEGVLQVGERGEVYRFTLLGETHDPEGLDLRVFALARLPAQTWDRLIQLLSPYLTPHWPVWIPIWRFPTDEVRKQIDSQVEALLGPAGPAEWQVTTTDLLGTLQQVQRGAHDSEVRRPAV